MTRLLLAAALVLQGKPFFPIGLYHVNHTDAEYAMIEANGFNAIEGSFTTNVEQFRRTLDLALKHHLAVDAPLFANKQVSENLEASIAKIRETGSHPALLSWKILDEPDADQNAPLREQARQEYRILKRLNPARPLELTLSQDDTLAYWSDYCDLVQIDRYPAPDKPLTEVSRFGDLAARSKKPWTFVVQCGWTPDLKTQPTFEQARCMVYLALIAGAKGIYWYSRQEEDWDLTTSPLWPRLKEINAEIASLSEPLLSGTDVAGFLCDAPQVRFVAKRYGSRIYLLATNPGQTPVNAVFTPPGGATKSVALGPFASETVFFK